MNEICKILRKLGIHSAYTGYYYIAYAIELVLQDEDYLFSATKRLYPEIASHYGVSVCSVEHAMRSMIASFWEQGGSQTLPAFLEQPLFRKPSTREFIALLADYMRFGK